MILEIAASSLESALVAQFAGAHRIEFYRDYQSGGLTPTYGEMKVLSDKKTVPVHVMIRPRAGDFLYSEMEFEVMLHDLALIKNLNFNGVVFGILNKDNSLDITRCKTLVELAKPLPCTLHRAFDQIPDSLLGLEDAIQCGFQRILTAGGRGQASENLDKLKQLALHAAGRIEIMPGGGVSSLNAAAFKQENLFTSLHASAITVKNNDGREVSDHKEIKAILSQLE